MKCRFNKTDMKIKAETVIHKRIPLCDGRYFLSNKGEVYDTKTSRIVKPHFSGVKRRNYHQVTLYGKDGLKLTKRIHSLMAITFLGHTHGDRKVVVDHINNDPLDNRIENLQIISMKENNTKDK